MPVDDDVSKLNELRDLSARIGRDPLLVQANTGNTSIKIGDLLWIKASGKWLTQSWAGDFLVAVPLALALRSVRDGVDVPASAVSWGDGSPSIETAMHAVLPHKVVLHVHSVNTIAWAVRADGPRQLENRLRGIPWTWIPYRPSGIALAREVYLAMSSCPEAAVFVLGNHGLVVCGDACHSAELLLNQVESRLAIAPRPHPEPNVQLLTRAASQSNWVLSPFAEAHSLATDELSRRISSQGVLYPCQAMFLPDTVPTLARSLGQERGTPTIRVVDTVGVLCHKHATSAQHELLKGLAEVVQRIDLGVSPRYLSSAETNQVLRGPVYQESAPILRKTDLKKRTHPPEFVS
jgi:rhamnose utilization protein RhaD (predicted bifunctional aldolase and dehydrogenase)